MLVEDNKENLKKCREMQAEDVTYGVQWWNETPDDEIVAIHNSIQGMIGSPNTATQIVGRFAQIGMCHIQLEVKRRGVESN